MPRGPLSIPVVDAPVIPRVRCAPFRESTGADPIGSAGAYDGFLVIDVPLPWEREVSGQEPIRSVVDGPSGAVVAGDGSRWRPLARVPDPGLADRGLVRVTEHRSRTVDVDGIELRGPYEAREWIVSRERVVALGRAVLGLEPPTDQDAVDADELAAWSAPDGVGLLMCTHGRRDQCCGSLGTSVFEELDDVFAASGAAVDAQRISHTGGHRFAPTAITFPDGYAWAQLDADLCDLLVRRAAPPETFASHCRGSSLMAGAPQQVADRAALVEVGWGWADAARTVQLVDFDRSTMATTVRITGLLADSTLRSFDVTAAPDHQVPSPTCGIVDGPEYATDTVWRVDGVRAL